MSRSEKAIQNDILRTFGVLPWLRIWRRNVGVGDYYDRRTGRHRKVRFGEPGMADLWAVVNGLHIEIEVKSATGRQSKDQRCWQAIMEQQGCVYILARSVQDVWDALEQRYGRFWE